MNLKGTISFMIGVAGLLLCWVLQTGELKSTLFKIAIGFVLAGIIDFIVFLFENKKHWKLYQTKIFKRSKPVRVTVAYLFRIEVNGKYVLIKRQIELGFSPLVEHSNILKKKTVNYSIS
jgi:membrane protease YdiL (CAAX protease family)